MSKSTVIKLNPVEFVAIQECSAGNAEVGDMWLETGTFSPDATLAEVWMWCNSHNGAHGRLMIRPNTSVSEGQT